MINALDSNWNNFSSYLHEDNPRVVISYLGPVTKSVITEFCEEIKQKLEADERVVRKVFSVFLELTHNVLKYSEYKTNSFNIRKSSLGFFALYQEKSEETNQTTYKIIAGNPVKKPELEKLSDYCEYINSLDGQHLRSLKREKRMQSLVEDEFSENAGIGLIKVKMLSNAPLKYSSIDIDQHYSFFTFQGTVAKDL